MAQLLPKVLASLLREALWQLSVATRSNAKLSRVACGLLQEEAGIVLESSDQKTRGFVVQIALPR
jgi:hypothetical protein